MILKDISFKNPKENILYDEVLLMMAEKNNGPSVLRFWESEETFIVLGRISQEHEDLEFDRITEDDISVLRRSSGGGTVVQGRGCMNYTLVMSKDEDKDLADIKKSYDYILGKIVQALNSINVGCRYLPISDIVLAHNNKKISGNAQKRGRNFILHHGTILYNFSLTLIERYLKIPKDVPSYRNNRSHLDFVTNVDCTSGEIKESIRDVFEIQENSPELQPDECLCLNELLSHRNIQVFAN